MGVGNNDVSWDFHSGFPQPFVSRLPFLIFHASKADVGRDWDRNGPSSPRVSDARVWLSRTPFPCGKSDDTLLHAPFHPDRTRFPHEQPPLARALTFLSLLVRPYLRPGRFAGHVSVSVQVFRKLPISLQVLRTLKGVGRSVNIISTSDVFDEGESSPPFSYFA